MKRIFAIALGAASLVLAGAAAADAADVPVYRDQGLRGGVKIGFLDCFVGGGIGYVLGSAKEIDCGFYSALSGEPLDRYSGAIRKLGVDVGFTTRTRVIWAVFAPTAGYRHGSLSGLYKGATAEATVGAGIGTNVLFGGTSGSVHLQPVSVTGQIGLNVAATGTSMTLASVN
ncbi:DUF992 domain-containing protein [Phyllobacterium brassicacearum]|uniref:DUF992 domain-containing protein n=1 Tax=Phyllobacterium brassicacearum TaxID=314235 RepID=A0A2P7BN61_9HYPH|nr:DUF992 domain-containing protein [Phyllobacterium brassicacearum]PSH67900.1 DUF992 domain-containing protein [Phyllobacterium brassicacearum]TDQ27302.1 uncharacterized protein DUF992 [Phyllobacterium brassicacearum]